MSTEFLPSRQQHTSVHPPTVDPKFRNMGEMQRAIESLCYGLLCFEFWLSPHGHLRKWLRRNVLLSTWLLIPAILVMPVVGLILWQVTGWLSMLSAIFGHLIILPVMVLLALVSISIAVRIITALIKR